MSTGIWRSDYLELMNESPTQLTRWSPRAIDGAHNMGLRKLLGLKSLDHEAEDERKQEVELRLCILEAKIKNLRRE